MSPHRLHPASLRLPAGLLLAAWAGTADVGADVHVYLADVPDYEWHAGCFGTANGNLFGYWDRNGFPDFYTGPTAGGVAPLDSRNSLGHGGIRALWASQAGVDGRPAGVPGHMDDFYVAYESTAPDPHVTAGRPAHAPDCIGDFIGLNQDRWEDLNGECSGNIDAYSFVHWDPNGARRVADPDSPGIPPGSDIPNGLVEWTRHCGYDAEVACQLSDFNPGVAPGAGFTFADLRTEIDAGYPVLLFMQAFDEFDRTLFGVAGVNPRIHGMLAYGYLETDDGQQYVRFRTSWASGDLQFARWTAGDWTPEGLLNLPLRGVMTYHPRPRLRPLEATPVGWRLRWDGPSALLVDANTEGRSPVHGHVVETAADPAGPWTEVSPVLTNREFLLPPDARPTGFYRIRVVTLPPA